MKKSKAGPIPEGHPETGTWVLDPATQRAWIVRYYVEWDGSPMVKLQRFSRVRYLDRIKLRLWPQVRTEAQWARFVPQDLESRTIG